MLTVDDPEKYPVYPYRCLMRPPGPGAVPSEGLSYCEYNEGTTLGGHHFWGTAVYTRRLTQEEVEHYDMEETSFVVYD